MTETQTSSKSASWQNPENSTEETHSHTIKTWLFPRRPNRTPEHLLQSENSIQEWKQTWSAHQQNTAGKILQMPSFLSCFILSSLYSESFLLKYIEIKHSTIIKKRYSYLHHYQKRCKWLHLKTLAEKKKLSTNCKYKC